MIKFFRRIRQDLLSRGKTGKYIQYALGEIILVVIGILIALQINNWNQNNQLKKLEHEYIMLLKEDLNLDIQHFSDQIDILSKDIQYVDNLFLMINDPKATPKTLDSLIKANLNVFGVYDDYNINNSTYLALQNSGNINLLQKEIRKQLTNLNKAQKRHVLLIKDNSEALGEKAINFLDLVPFSDNSKNQRTSTNIYNQLWNSVDWQKARIKFISFLTLKKLISEGHIQSNKAIMDKTKNMLRLINKSIDLD
jgi:hypothetical protein